MIGNFYDHLLGKYIFGRQPFFSNKLRSITFSSDSTNLYAIRLSRGIRAMRCVTLFLHLLSPSFAWKWCRFVGIDVAVVYYLLTQPNTWWLELAGNMSSRYIKFVAIYYRCVTIQRININHDVAFHFKSTQFRLYSTRMCCILAAIDANKEHQQHRIYHW